MKKFFEKLFCRHDYKTHECLIYKPSSVGMTTYSDIDLNIISKTLMCSKCGKTKIEFNTPKNLYTFQKARTRRAFCLYVVGHQQNRDCIFFIKIRINLKL